MDGIGPILGVRAVTMRKPDRPAPDLSRVFEAEYLGDAPEDSDSREENALDGDLEEPRVTLADTADSPGRSGDDAPPSSIDCFA